MKIKIYGNYIYKIKIIKKHGIKFKNLIVNIILLFLDDMQIIYFK